MGRPQSKYSSGPPVPVGPAGFLIIVLGGALAVPSVLLRPGGSVWLCWVVLVVMVYHVHSIALFLLCCMFWPVLEPSIPLFSIVFIYLFIRQIFIEHLLCAGQCSRCWSYNFE